MTKKKDQEVEETFVRPFLDWLREQSGGSTADELSHALHELVEKVNATGKKGYLTLKIQVSMLKDIGQIVVQDNITVNAPEFDRASTIWFTDKHGNLTRRDPNQLEFEALREVPLPATVDLTTGEIIEERKVSG